MPLYKMTPETIVRFIPSYGRMRAALEPWGMVYPFVDGVYQRAFFGTEGSSRIGSERAWAQAYAQNRQALEYAAQEAYSLDGLLDWSAAQLTLSLAAKHSGMSTAQVAIGISPCFEAWLDRNVPGQVPSNPLLARTEQQAAYMQGALDAVGPEFPLLRALNDAKSVEDFMLSTLSFAMLPGYSQDDRDKLEYSAVRYRASVYQWLGKGYESALTAVRLAKLGVTPGDIQGYARAGLSVEYATALI